MMVQTKCCGHCRPMPHFEEPRVLENVQQLTNDRLAQALAQEQGMVFQTVSWEDTARFKNSCWGPNISDMTLQVKDDKGSYHRMPVLRRPNFFDKTHDVPLDRFTLPVGNEKGEQPLKRLSLKDYLTGHFATSLLAERDTHVIHSVQACFLPAAKGEEAHFNVALYNYQSYKDHPAILTLVVSNHGTSAQVIENSEEWDGQKLLFDKEGKGCDFIAGRLKDIREQQGRSNAGPLNEQELADRTLRIIQIPLKVTPPDERFAMMADTCLESAHPKVFMALGMDDAQIRIGEERGPFKGVQGFKLERDERFPIRVTTQLYKMTDSGMIGRAEMEQVAAEIKREEAIGEKGSSLVLENSDRPTEWNLFHSFANWLRRV